MTITEIYNEKSKELKNLLEGNPVPSGELGKFLCNIYTDKAKDIPNIFTYLGYTTVNNYIRNNDQRCEKFCEEIIKLLKNNDEIKERLNNFLLYFRTLVIDFQHNGGNQAATDASGWYVASIFLMLYEPTQYIRILKKPRQQINDHPLVIFGINADLINRKAVKKLALVSQELNIKLVHISTDYVFDGKNFKPYVEEFQTNPQGVYGKTKLDGENEMRDINPKNSIIIRTSWVYSSFGNNFVKTMIKLGTERDSLNVIFDQVGTPTYAADLADAILKIASAESFVPGIYHFSDEGVCSWYDFTKTIHRICSITCNVQAIESKDYPARTPRPHYSVLNKSKIKSTYNIQIPHWEESLIKCIEALSAK